MTDFVKTRWENMMLAALADGKWAEREHKYLERFREELGICKDEANEIFEKVKTYGGKLQYGTTPSQERAVLRDIICVSLIDGEICDREREMIESAAGHVGLTGGELEELISICSIWIERYAPERRDD